MGFMSDDTLQDQWLCDKAQAVAGREYRQLRALMLTGPVSEVARAREKLRDELPPELSNDASFQKLLQAMSRDVMRVAEQDILAEASLSLA